MKTLYIECAMGAAGDMLLGALLELDADPQGFLREMNGWGLPGVAVTAAKASRCGITGTRVSVTVAGEEEESLDAVEPEANHDHGHHHEEDHSHGHHHGEHYGHHGIHMSDIKRTVAGLPLPVGVCADVLAVYALLAGAEADAHGCALSNVHFSEVGMMDAIADIAGVCSLMARIAPGQVVVSPVSVGGGQVHTSHGILPVPAPATARLLEGIPSRGGPVQVELCTPTGAALLRHFATGFGVQPSMAVTAVGYGMGKKEFNAANCVRAFLGETPDSEEGDVDHILEISCNLDDMTGEALGYAQELLLASGALDVFTQPIQMKKSRPGQMLVCLCRPDLEEEMTRLIFAHTTTFGVRIAKKRRRVLRRESLERQTPWGVVRVKRGSGYGVSKCKPEYEDLARIAREKGVSIADIVRNIDEII